MTDTTQTPGPIQPITSFPNYGSFFPSFPFQGLNSQFGASMAPFGGGYGGWGMPQQYGGMGGWPSLFGGGMMPQQYGGMGGMGGYGMGGMPFGGGMGGQFPFGSTLGQGMQQMGVANQGGVGMQAPGNPSANLPQTPIAPGTVPNVPGTMGPPGAGAASTPGAPMQPPSWNATQLAQANGISPGLADFMLAHNAGADSNPGNQQFYQAAGFTNPAGSQTMLNSAGRDWLLNNNQSYGNINADAGQPNGQRLGYGMAGNTPYSYSLGQAANNPALQQWLMRARGGAPNLGPPPSGATLYSQFGGG